METNYYWNKRINKAYTELTNEELEELLEQETITILEAREELNYE